MTTSSRNQLDGKVIPIRRGLAIYKVNASPYYRVRIWLPSKKKRVVRTTKTTTRIEAIAAAEELFSQMGSRGTLNQAPRNRTFEHFANKLVEQEKSDGLAKRIYKKQHANTRNLLNHPEWGAVDFFENNDIGDIGTKEFNAYKAFVRKKNPSLSAGTLNHVAVAVRKVFSTAYDDGAIPSIPATPRDKRKDNPRSFFRFDPLISKEKDEYKRLLKEARAMAAENVVIKGDTVTEELRDIIIFITHSFVRPTVSELFSLKHSDITEHNDPKGLTLNIQNGKTGHRASETMEAAASVYARIKARDPNHGDDDYIFLPKVRNRETAQKVFQRQFQLLLKRAGLEKSHTGGKHSLYSLRHTAICMRLVLSHGKVNIYTLAKNAGTSVDQIERFYAKRLPLTKELLKNLQSFGED